VTVLEAVKNDAAEKGQGLLKLMTPGVVSDGVCS
jgi:hypothetical protein